MKALFITLHLILFKLWCRIQIQTGDWSSRYPVCKHMNREAARGKAGPLRSRDGLREEEDAFTRHSGNAQNGRIKERTDYR